MIIILIAVYLLEKIIPFSRDIKGIENGNISYYRANTALNDALLAMSVNTPGLEPSGGAAPVNGSGMTFSVKAMGDIIPRPGL